MLLIYIFIYSYLQISNQGKQTITIPSCLADGQYLLRPELIALHGGKDMLNFESEYQFLTCLQHQAQVELSFT